MIDGAATCALLEAHVGTLAPAGPHAWRFVLAGATPRAGHAVLDGTWLTLTVDGARIRAGAPADPFAVFIENGGLDAGLRCVLARSGRGLAHRADVSLDAESDVATRLAEVVAALGGVDPGHAERDGTPAGQALSAGLARRVADAGWRTESRGDDALAVDLSCAGPSRYALVTRTGDTVRLRLSLVDPLALVNPPAAAIGARAAARLLMHTAGIVRLVRTVARAGDPASLAFEIVLTDPSTRELAGAFGALATAADLAGAEVSTLLHDEAVARLYLHHRADAAVARAA